MTYRDRREARADNLREWADKRVTSASEVIERNRVFTGDIAFNTQPGHIPLRARVIRQNDRAIESIRKADGMASRADGIEHQLASSIYSDDPDAVEALEARIVKLEAQREQIKADNTAFRKAHKAELAALTVYGRDQIMPHAGYELTNLSGNIKRNKDRLVVVKRQQARTQAAADAGGVSVIEHSNGYVTVTFYEKPERAVLDALKASGFRWSGGSWFGTAERLPESVTL